MLQFMADTWKVSLRDLREGRLIGLELSVC